MIYLVEVDDDALALLKEPHAFVGMDGVIQLAGQNRCLALDANGKSL